MPPIQFATQSYKSASLPISSQRALNCYAEKEPQDAKSPVAVLGLHGLTNFATLGNGPIRAMHVMGGMLYVLSGGTLYSVSSAGVATVLGGTVTGSGPIVMIDNGTQLFMVNGANGYVYTTADGFQIVTDPNFHAATSTTFFDLYFVLTWDGTQKFYISNSDDGTTYNALAFATAEVSSPNVVAVVNQQENLLIFCGNRIEVWYDAGTPIFPFQPILGSTIERGCAAALTPVKEDNSVFFLGDDLIFYRLDNFIPRRISTHALEDAWKSYTTVSDAFTFSYSYEGHKFIVLTFQSANATFVYDIATGLWHERDSWDMNNNELGRWRGNCVASAYNKIFIGDAFSGQVGYADPTVSTEFGNTIRTMMVSPPVHADRRRIFHGCLELDMQTGVGNAALPVVSPILSSIAIVTSASATAASTANVAIGQGVVLFVSALNGSGSHIASVTDSAGNTYSKVVAENVQTGAEIWYNGTISHAIVSGSTKWTATCAAGSSQYSLNAYSVPVALSADQTAVATGTGTSFSISTGTLSSANEIVFGFYFNDNFVVAKWMEGGGFVDLLDPATMAANGIAYSYQVASSANSLTWNPSWTTAEPFDAVLASFKVNGPSLVNYGPGANPQVMLDWSDDEGRTYIPLQQWNSLGQIGQYKTRLRWTRLGQSRDRRYRVHITDPVPRTLMQAHLLSSVGMPTAGNQ